MNQALIAIFTVMALALPGVFKSDKLADWQNGTIALVVVALFSLLTVLVGGRLSGNVTADWALFAGIYGALLGGPGKPLDDWLMEHVHFPPSGQ